MKAISLYEPWASFIMWEWKTIETRTHTRFRHLVGQTIAIHATKKFDDYSDTFYPYLLSKQKEEFNKALGFDTFKENAGKVIGYVQVSRFEPLSEKHSFSALIDCGRTMRYGLFLDDPVRLVTPFKYKGSQGIFNIPDEFIFEAMKRRCRKCQCTDDDCRGCIERTGEPCHWVESDLCSACLENK